MRRRHFIRLICGLATATTLTSGRAEKPSKLIVWISAFPVARGSEPLGFLLPS